MKAKFKGKKIEFNETAKWNLYKKIDEKVNYRCGSK